MFCAKCGSEIPSDSRFCSRCGAPVQGIASPTTRPIYCPTCGTQQVELGGSCRQCQQTLSDILTRTPRTAPCATCGLTSPADARYCIGCGVRWPQSGGGTSAARPVGIGLPTPSSAVPVGQLGSSVGPLGFQVSSAAVATCAYCGRPWGNGRACQFCRQVSGLPAGVTLASPLRRLAGYLLDGLLFWLLLIVIYIAWTLFTYAEGQTPGKKLLGMRVVSLQTNLRATWWRMFLRQVIAQPVIATLSYLTFGIPLFWLIWDKDNQELWDKLVGTVVVHDPEGKVTVG